MNLNKFMENGITQLIKTAGKYYLQNPKGIAFLAKIAPEIKKSATRREWNEARGTHVPPLIIASIASRCNLHCAGCYARATGACDDESAHDLTAQEWGNILEQASALGVSFMLLAGGEPLLRRDVVQTAAQHKNMVFPIFTNGTMIDETYMRLFEQNRNLIPVFSIEGNAAQTDARRGAGAYSTVQAVMAQFNRRHMLFGASITVTNENRQAVTSPEFVAQLQKNGCGVLFFVEYVPIEPDTEHLMLNEHDVKQMQAAVDRLKQQFDNMILVSFPGDEEAMGGCLASGRGFFHINAGGGAEPCPFSPHSTLNLKTDSMETVLRSGFFRDLREIAANAGHNGGCTLFAQEKQVLDLLQNQ